MRLSTPCSRRKVTLKASAVKVVDITDMPAIPGTITLRSCWLPWRIAPKKARNRSGRRKLKKAALGLRQNSRRSRRYWRQASETRSGIAFLRRRRGHELIALHRRRRGHELQVHVLERGTCHAQRL